jgi:hypothetical protein
VRVGKRTTSATGWEAAEREQQAWVEFDVKVATPVLRYEAPYVIL